MTHPKGSDIKDLLKPIHPINEQSAFIKLISEHVRAASRKLRELNIKNMRFLTFGSIKLIEKAKADKNITPDFWASITREALREVWDQQ